MTETKKMRLIDRIESNYFNFKESLGSLSREKLINTARRIAAVSETYEMLTRFYEWEEDSEIDFFLLFRDPLAIVADAWENRKNEMIEDFDCAMFDLAFSDEVISEYPLIGGVDLNLCNNIMSFCSNE